MTIFVPDTTNFLAGPAGTGKSSTAMEFILEISNSKHASDEILVLIPQKSLGIKYGELKNEYPNLNLQILTITGLAKNVVELFWPLISEQAGFKFPNRPPTFLTLETAQYFMARVVRPMLDEEDFFESVRIDRNRLYSQIIDNLNKAALNGYPHTLVGERLKLATVGDPEQQRIYQDAQFAVNAFREYCLDHNLVDLSLQMDLFTQYLWQDDSPAKDYLLKNYQHIIYDNVEEDPPIAHDMIRDWLPHLKSAALIFDTDAGNRKFLGADPQSGYSLRHGCEHEFARTIEEPSQLEIISNRMGQLLKRPQTKSLKTELSRDDVLDVVDFSSHQYFPEMLDWVAEEVDQLLAAGTPPSEIVILSPFLSDSLRFSLTEKLSRYDIPIRSHRPSRSLRDEPITVALISLASIAHPDWGFKPKQFDIAYMLTQLIDGLDLVRAQLLTENTYKIHADGLPLSPFAEIKPNIQARITYAIGEKFDHLRNWLLDYSESEDDELDIFLSRAFGEVLAQPNFGLHGNLSAGEITANLIDSIQNFRWLADSDVFDNSVPVGKEYIQILQDGLIAGTYLRSWREDEEAILIAPAYTFLMRNRKVQYQFWLDIGSQGWHELIDQPITHPFVLSRNWALDQYWSDADVVEANADNLYRLSLGLMRRCTGKIYMTMSGLGETGYEYQGLLMKTMQGILQLTNARAE